MKNTRGYFFILALTVVFGGGLFWKALANERLREEQAQLKARAVAAKSKAAKSNQQTSAMIGEETQPSQQASAEAAELKESIEKLKAALNKPTSPVAVKPLPKPVVERWKNQGLATPANTLESVVWAALGGEIDQLATMLVYDPESRAAADALYASLSPESRKYFPNAEKLLTSLIVSRVPTDLVNAKPIDQTSDNPDLVVASFQLQGSSKSSAEPRNVVFRFQRVGSDWKLVVPKTVVAEFQSSLKGE